jgi:hypothetical protein
MAESEGGGRQSFSNWLRSKISTNPSERSPYYALHTRAAGFRAAVEERYVHRGWADVGFNRTKDLSARAEAARLLKDAEFTESFECHPKAEYVSSVEYDRKHWLLKMNCVKSRTGARGGKPPGSSVVYDHVPPHVYDYLSAMRGQHIGRIVWNMFRVRGFEQESKYPYSDM